MTTPLKIRVLLADDHEMVRRGLRLILDAEPDIEVVGEAADGEAAFRTLLDGGIDLAILDVAMQRLTGLQAARRLKQHQSEVRVLILSMHDNEQYFFEALNAGACGYVLKTMASRDLVAACRAVMRGEPFIYPKALGALMREYLDSARRGESVRSDPLTPRELEVVKLIAEGCSTREIAEQLVIAEKTVERHRSNILDKLELRDRVALTRYAIRRGLVEP